MGKHDETKENIMFWTEPNRKARFIRACAQHNLSMTDAIERFVSAITAPGSRGKDQITVDLGPALSPYSPGQGRIKRSLHLVPKRSKSANG